VQRLHYWQRPAGKAIRKITEYLLGILTHIEGIILKIADFIVEIISVLHEKSQSLRLR
jgi:hypothetical protein